MRFGLIISTLLHASLLLVVAYGLPRLAKPLEIDEEPLLIELVTIGEVTTPQAPPTPAPKPVAETKAEAEPEPEKEAPKETPLPPPAVAAAPPLPKLALARPPQPPRPEQPPPTSAPQPPQPAETPPPPVPKLEAKPPAEPERPKLSLAPPPPEAKPVPSPKPPPPMPKPAAATPAPPVPDVPKPPPGKVFEKQTLGRIAALLDKSREPAPPQPAPRDEEPQQRAAPKGPPAVASGREQREMTIRELDALMLTIKRQIESCWTVPAGARDAENLAVRLRIMLNPDGSLVGLPEILDSSGLLSRNDEFYRTAAESARRAVLACAPLKDLPVDAYDHWREVTLNFNPQEMLQ